MNVLESIKPVIKKLEYVDIVQTGIDEFATNMRKEDLEVSEIKLSKYSWDLEALLQLTFYFNSINFCFWAEKDKPKWIIEVEGEELDGSVALFRLLESQLRMNPDFFSSKSILNMGFNDFGKYFKGNVQIPLVKERYDNFKNTAEVLDSRYDGKFSKILELTNSDAKLMLDIIAENFSSFKDASIYKKDKIYFLKRAQLQVKMVHDALLSKNQKGLKNLNILTAFADYKVPQMLRHFGIIEYSKELANKIDNYKIIEKDSAMENEIRIATIWAIELIRQIVSEKFTSVTASHIDSYLWNKSQIIDKASLKPYHRTYTAAY